MIAAWARCLSGLLLLGPGGASARQNFWPACPDSVTGRAGPGRHIESLRRRGWPLWRWTVRRWPGPDFALPSPLRPRSGASPRGTSRGNRAASCSVAGGGAERQGGRVLAPPQSAPPSATHTHTHTTTATPPAARA